MPHAFLFVSPSKDSLKEMGMWLAKKVLCSDPLSELKFEHGNHEDFISVQKPEDRESLGVAQIEELIEKLRFKPYGSTYAVLIEDAGIMRPEAQNKLLKTLEEPDSPCVMILLSERQGAMLSTVQSRCAVFILEDERVPGSEFAEAAGDKFINLIISGAPYYKKKAVLADILADKDNARERALEFLDILEEKLEMELLKNSSDVEVISRAVKQAETGRMYLKQLHSVAYTLKQMCLRV